MYIDKTVNEYRFLDLALNLTFRFFSYFIQVNKRTSSKQAATQCQVLARKKKQNCMFPWKYLWFIAGIIMDVAFVNAIKLVLMNF